MANKPTPKKPVDPDTLTHADFRWFILHFPAQTLKDVKIRRAVFVAVGLTLAQFGDYATGSRVNPSKKTLRALSGAHHASINKVLGLLKKTGALEAVETHQGVNGGQPYEVFRFRRSPAVEQVLRVRDAHNWEGGASTSSEPASTSSEPASTSSEVSSATSEHNRNVSNTMNEKNHESDKSSSPASMSLRPSARDDAAEEIDTALGEIDLDGFDDILANL